MRVLLSIIVVILLGAGLIAALIYKENKVEEFESLDFGEENRLKNKRR